MTKEEFGLPLLRCMQHIGRILACRDQYAGVVHKGTPEAVEAKRAELTELRDALPPLMDALTTEDAAAVVNRYPWVLS